MVVEVYRFHQFSERDQSGSMVLSYLSLLIIILAGGYGAPLQITAEKSDIYVSGYIQSHEEHIAAIRIVVIGGFPDANWLGVKLPFNTYLLKSPFDEPPSYATKGYNITFREIDTPDDYVRLADGKTTTSCQATVKVRFNITDESLLFSFRAGSSREWKSDYGNFLIGPRGPEHARIRDEDNPLFYDIPHAEWDITV